MNRITLLITIVALALWLPALTQTGLPSVESRQKEIIDSLNDASAAKIPEAGLEDARRALKMAQAIEYQVGIATAYVNLGIYYSYFSDYKNCEYYLKEAQNLFDSLNLKNADYLDVLDGLSVLNADLHRYNEAIAYAIKLEKEAGQQKNLIKQTNAEEQLAGVYDAILYHEKSTEHARKAIELARKTRDTSLIAEAYVMLGEIFLNQEKYDSAEIYYKLSLQLMEDINNPVINEYYILNAKGALAEIASGKGQYDKAITMAKENLSRYTDKSDPHLKAMDHLSIATSYFKTKNNEESLQHVKKALAIAHELNDYVLLEDAYLLLRDISLSQNQVNKYILYDKKYEMYHDSTSNANRLKEIAGLKARYDFEKQEEEKKALQQRNEFLQFRNRYYFIIAATLLLTAIGLGILVNRLRQQKQIIEEQKAELLKTIEMKDNLFAIIGHDMRNAVHSFRGITDKVHYLIESGQLERIPQLDEAINTSLNNLTGMLNNLLDWALSQKNALPFHPEDIDLNDLVEESIESFRNIALRRKIDIENHLEPGQYIHADRKSMLTVLRNLLFNSIKYTPPGGVIFFAAKEDEKNVILEVSDTGKGIPPGVLSKIFEIDRSKIRKGLKGEKGSGIGLTLVKELVELNQGIIAIQSETGKGTTVQIRFPKDHRPGKS